MRTNVVVLSEPSQVNGLVTWKDGLVCELKKNGIKVGEPLGGLKNLFKDIKKIKNSTVVHGYYLTIGTISLLLISKILGKKIVFTLHGNFFEEIKAKSGLKKIFFIPMYKYFLRQSHTITFPSKFLYNKIVEKMPDIKSKSQIIFNGTSLLDSETNETTRPDKTINILEITNFNYFDKARGVIPLIESIKRINQGNLKLNLSILGDGKYLPDFKHLENSRIKFLGRQNPRNYLNRCHLFVHSTFLDNQPYVIIEAAIKNIPVISVDIGGIPEMICPECITTPDVDGLEKKIKQFLRHPDIAQSTVSKNKKLLDNFLWKNVIKNFINIYEA